MPHLFERARKLVMRAWVSGLELDRTLQSAHCGFGISRHQQRFAQIIKCIGILRLVLSRFFQIGYRGFFISGLQQGMSEWIKNIGVVGRAVSLCFVFTFRLLSAS